MEEKTKRSEKAKNKAKRGENPQPFIFVSLMLVVVLLVGVALVIFLVMQPSQEELEFRSTIDAIETQNTITTTLISASATAFIATVTAEAAQGQ